MLPYAPIGGLLGGSPGYDSGGGVGNYGRLSGLAGAAQRGILSGATISMEDLLSWSQRNIDDIPKPKTIRQKLQAETDEWLKNVFN